jgi:hypothetical protein
MAKRRTYAVSASVLEVMKTSGRRTMCTAAIQDGLLTRDNKKLTPNQVRGALTYLISLGKVARAKVRYDYEPAAWRVVRKKADNVH